MRHSKARFGLLAVFLWMGHSLEAADKTPLRAPERAPTNRWTPIAKGGFGIRIGSALFYSEPIGRFVLAMGVSGNPKCEIPRPYDIQTFSLEQRVWENWFPPGKEGVWGGRTGSANPPGYPLSINYFHIKDKEGNIRPTGNLPLINGFAVEPGGGAFYIYVRGYRRLMGVKPGAIWRYDVVKRTWSEVSPEHEIDIPSHGGPPTIRGARLVYEPTRRPEFTAAIPHLKRALTLLRSAADALDKATLDGTALEAMERAHRAVDAAANCLASEPPP